MKFFKLLMSSTLVLFSTVHAMVQEGKTAVVSVFNKNGIVELVNHLCDNGYTRILSTGGTYKYLVENVKREHIYKINDVGCYTGFPEILDGRVKTLHPKIHGGILAKQDNATHMLTLQERDIAPISCVVANLYPFQDVTKNKEVTEEIALENIDIGGVTLIRAAAKNYHHVTVITDPEDYDVLMNNIEVEQRKELAVKAFAHVLKYDAAIANYISKGAIVSRIYNKIHNLKYGLNPHQKQAALYTINDKKFPLTFLNGDPGYINILDALNSWNLVRDVRNALHTPCAASFKHNSPAGVGIGTQISDLQKKMYGLEKYELTNLAIAYALARNCDWKCSFGDVAAVSHQVDKVTADLIAREVSDGIIAPSYSEEALEVLKKKRNGKFLIMQALDEQMEEEANDWQVEFREMQGIALSQEPNSACIDESLFEKIVTKNQSIPAEKFCDLILATIALKYTQSNSVAFGLNGQVFAGAGQQSRVDCVKLAGGKLRMAYLRQHPKAIALLSIFKPEVKRQDRINALTLYLEEGKFNPDLFVKSPEEFTQEEKNIFVQTLCEVVLSSDAFFPFRDNIDVAAAHGVKYIAQPGGSISDEDIIKACDEHGIAMVQTDKRLFTH